jgi:hypothetical protein
MRPPVLIVSGEALALGEPLQAAFLSAARLPLGGKLARLATSRAASVSHSLRCRSVGGSLSVHPQNHA